MKFSYSLSGYIEAIDWLKEIGKYEEAKSRMVFSTDGYSLVHEANSLWEKMNKLTDKLLIEKYGFEMTEVGVSFKFNDPKCTRLRLEREFGEDKFYLQFFSPCVLGLIIQSEEELNSFYRMVTGKSIPMVSKQEIDDLIKAEIEEPKLI